MLAVELLDQSRWAWSDDIYLVCIVAQILFKGMAITLVMQNKEKNRMTVANMQRRKKARARARARAKTSQQKGPKKDKLACCKRKERMRLSRGKVDGC